MAKITRNSTTITVSDFYENHILKKYNFDPKYQRKSVWSEEKQAYLVDSMLNNYPIPPVFLHQIIDAQTGKTNYDVIDGKQRLMSIISFIEDRLYIANELEDENLKLAGMLFSEIPNDVKSEFWKYRLPVELIDIEDEKTLDKLFDRLNRNGEKLNGQELRKSNYYNSPLLKVVNNICETHIFWKSRLSVATDLSRMEDQEFVSELIFALNEDKIYSSSPEIIDKKYEEYSKFDDNWASEITEKFNEVTNLMENFNINYDEFRISGVSHLYGLWLLSIEKYKSRDDSNISTELSVFFEKLRTQPITDDYIREYKLSMSSGTKMQTQRARRRDALLKYIYGQ
ncbi:DUF262 domain-containing protein [Rheinheimera texasensis]|uniref:DUF262 domain-containing protein n=1 Tax=Rheinheimera texasensis TaxID=306205 RepID=UPI0032B1696C